MSDAASWQEYVDKNTDPYGSCCVRYAQRWAEVMEAEMLDGATIGAIAKRTSHDANTEGITGFMYGCAVAMLAKCWEHGDDLRRWHNLDRQIGDEGERANEGDGVLNPALLSIGLEDDTCK